MFYLTITTYPDLGIGASDPGSFDDAVDVYSQHRDQGHDARVYRCEPENNRMEDVTADADKCIVRRLTQRGWQHRIPEWLEECEYAS